MQNCDSDEKKKTKCEIAIVMKKENKMRIAIVMKKHWTAVMCFGSSVFVW